MLVLFYLDLFLSCVFKKEKTISEKKSRLVLLLSLSLFLFCFRKREKATTRSDDDERRSSFRVFCERSFFRPKPFFDSRQNHNRVFVLRIGKREKKGRETFQALIVMFVTPKRDDDDVNDAEEEEEEHRTLENRGEEKVVFRR